MQANAASVRWLEDTAFKQGLTDGKRLTMDQLFFDPAKL